MPTLYLEDLTVGREIESARRTVTEADIAAFCGVSGDFNPLHTDDVFVAEHTPFRARIAHGLLVLAISSGLRSEIDDVMLIAYLEESRRFRAPTYAGDTIQVRYRVEAARPSSSRPGQGIVTLAAEVVKHDGEVVQSGTDVILVAARPAEER
jgi:3-hydroxybutyryl-CoA dehydratase